MLLLGWVLRGEQPLAAFGQHKSGLNLSCCFKEIINTNNNKKAIVFTISSIQLYKECKPRNWKLDSLYFNVQDCTEHVFFPSPSSMWKALPTVTFFEVLLFTEPFSYNILFEFLKRETTLRILHSVITRTGLRFSNSQLRKLSLPEHQIAFRFYCTSPPGKAM